jgi:NAD(P)-dependent dehydrogenase (short-subunit alcohol dehydrogenase family)
LLVNSAGTIGSAGVRGEEFDVWTRVMRVNLDTVFGMTKACLDLLKAAHGASVVNVSSVCAVRPCSSISYSVSKAGVDMFTKTASKELAKDGIRINAVLPGVVRSNLQMSAGLFADESRYEEWVDDMRASHPLGGIGEPEDVAAAVRFLASDSASWVTGATLLVDGGRAWA